MKPLTNNMKYAQAIAVNMYKKFKNNKFSLNDFIQASYEGMCHAINTYDDTKGASLNTWIFNQSQGKIFEMLNKETGECNMYIRRKYNQKYTISTKIINMHKTTDIVDESIFDLDEAQKKLTKKQSIVITLIRKGYCQSEIARIFGESKQGVNQAYLGALTKLKKVMRVTV